MTWNNGSRRWVLGVTVAFVAFALVACSGDSPANTTSGPGRQASQDAPVAALPAKVVFQPASGARDIAPGDPVTVSVTDGSVVDVRLTNPDGKRVAGQFSPDRHSWGTTEALGFGKTYAWSGTATGTDGKQVQLSGSFTTVIPRRTEAASLNVTDGQTYGIAEPIALTFPRPVKNKAAVEKALSVTTTPEVEGSWAWLDGDTSVHWRPKEYYAPGTKVTVHAKVYGLRLSDGVYGRQDVSASFTTGRSQIVRGDTRTHRMQVFQDGNQIADYPASYGLDSVAWRNTRSGTHVVMEKDPTYLMNNARGGYQNVFVRWAVRISDNGEFIHALPASEWAQGRKNVSHGCVNLSTDNADAYFGMAQIGDPVEITGSGQQLGPADGDYADWTYSWDAWTKLSAVDS